MRVIKVTEEIRRPGARTLKITTQIRRQNESANKIPEIRICGLWLLELGFEPLKRVNVITGENILIIRVDDDVMLDC